MHFTDDEKQILLSAKGVGVKVIERLEQMGIFSIEALAYADSSDILNRGAELTGSTCWKNSPQAKKAIQSAIQVALSHIDSP
jgi:predicted RecB family nuclease